MSSPQRLKLPVRALSVAQDGLEQVVNDIFVRPMLFSAVDVEHVTFQEDDLASEGVGPSNSANVSTSSSRTRLDQSRTIEQRTVRCFEGDIGRRWSSTPLATARQAQLRDRGLERISRKVTSPQSRRRKVRSCTRERERESFLKGIPCARKLPSATRPALGRSWPARDGTCDSHARRRRKGSNSRGFSLPVAAMDRSTIIIRFQGCAESRVRCASHREEGATSLEPSLRSRPCRFLCVRSC